MEPRRLGQHLRFRPQLDPHRTLGSRSEDFAELADAAGNSGSAEWARDLYDSAVIGFEDFWDPDRGLYVDHILDGRRQPAASQVAERQSAIISGLAPRRTLGPTRRAITDPDRLVVRSWVGSETGGYDHRRFAEQTEASSASTGTRIGRSSSPSPSSLRRARRRREGRARRAPCRPRPALGPVPHRRLRHLRRVLGLGHAGARLEQYADAGPGRVRPRHHARGARVRAASGWRRGSAGSAGSGRRPDAARLCRGAGRRAARQSSTARCRCSSSTRTAPRSSCRPGRTGCRSAHDDRPGDRNAGAAPWTATPGWWR